MRKIPSLQYKPFQLWLGLALFLNSIGCSGKSPDNTTQARQTLLEAEAYKSMIKVSKIGLAKGENYLGNQVYYVEGSLTNDGQRVIQRIELTFRFKDSLKQVVLQESRKAVEYKGSRGLEAQKSTRFQVAFDHLPKDWNYFIPDVEVGQVTLR